MYVCTRTASCLVAWVVVWWCYCDGVGFVDNYFFCGPMTSQFVQVGNAVPPLLANQIAHIVAKIFNSIKNNNDEKDSNQDSDKNKPLWKKVIS